MSILHVCGGDPLSRYTVTRMLPVFSTYVEVIPTRVSFPLGIWGILHVCGGDPHSFVFNACQVA